MNDLVKTEPTTPLSLIDRAIAQGANVDVLEKLMGLQERHQANEARKAFDEAIAAAKVTIPRIIKNKQVKYGQTNYKHATLGEIARTVDPVLAEHGLSYRFNTDSSEKGTVTVTCILSHRDGHHVSNSLSAPIDTSGSKNPIQAIGSSVTYLQRYTLSAGLGLAAADDDDATSLGNGATISDKQASQIAELALQAKANVSKLLEIYKAESISDLKVKDFEDILSKLRAKFAKVAP